MANILIVDDDHICRKVVKNALELNGHLTNEAHNGKDALKILEDSSMDLVILDMMMPSMGGIETLIELEKRKIETRCIAVSGYFSEESEAFTKLLDRFGVEYLFGKPLMLDSFLTAVNDVLQHSI